MREISYGCALSMNYSTEQILTTKITKATKVSDIDIFKLLDFVLFVSFVV